MIDIEIIWKSIHNLATEEEKAILNDWLKQDPKNQKYYYKQKEILVNGKSINPVNADIESSWKAFNEKVIRKNRYRYVWVSSAAAALLIAVLFVISNNDNFFSKKSVVSESTNFNKIEIEPGSNKAILVLDDGTEYNLSDSVSLSLNEAGATIKKEGAEIKYLSDLPIENNIEALKYNTLKVPRGGEFFIVLSDSSKIWLNSETLLKYPVHFSSNERIVTLEGEAYFEVKHSNKPFKVFTGEQIVEVLGTSFNISSYKEDSLTYTTLVEGKVQVSLKDNPKVKQTLLPNYQSYMYKNENMISVRQVDPFAYIAWKEGRFYFRQKPLSEIMNTLSRWYDVEIKIENEEVGNLKFTGDLKRYDRLDNILTLIKETNEITYEFTEGHQVLIK